MKLFLYRGWSWDIEAASTIVDGRALVQVPVSEFAPMLPAIHIETDHACVDLSDPLLLCDLAAPVDGHTRLLVDGWHRLCSATRRGVTTLPAQVLTVAEGMSVSGSASCCGCGDCTHVQFTTDEDEYCDGGWCDACTAKYRAIREAQWYTAR